MINTNLPLSVAGINPPRNQPRTGERSAAELSLLLNIPRKTAKTLLVANANSLHFLSSVIVVYSKDIYYKKIL